VAKKDSQYNGLLIVDKPGRTQSDWPDDEVVQESWPTSHDVVQMARRWSQQRRVGHTGTLDPMASGVLVLCLGAATRLVEYYQAHAKQYYAEIVLGCATDTYDACGTITRRTAGLLPDDAQVDAALRQFHGTILQTPPLYSAIKQGGESLHRKARRGEDVQLEPRPVTFHRLDLLQYEQLPRRARITLRMVCSAGTYVRSLAHDVGQALGTGAYLDILRREAAGPFTLADAHTPAQIEAAVRTARFARLLLPPGERLDMPRIHLSADLITRLGYGQKVVLTAADAWVAATHTAGKEAPVLARGVDTQGEFVGVLRYLGPPMAEHSASDRSGTVWKAEKWFAT